MRRSIILIVSLFTMSCSGQNKAENTAAAGGNAAEGAAAGVSLQPGLWEMRSQGAPPQTTTDPVDGSPSTWRHQVTRWCMDEAAARRPDLEQVAYTHTVSTGDCSEEVSFAAGRIQGGRECQNINGVVDSRSTFTGQYTPITYEILELRRDMSGGGAGEPGRIRSSGRRIGDCSEENMSNAMNAEQPKN